MPNVMGLKKEKGGNDPKQSRSKSPWKKGSSRVEGEWFSLCCHQGDRVSFSSAEARGDSTWEKSPHIGEKRETMKTRRSEKLLLFSRTRRACNSPRRGWFTQSNMAGMVRRRGVKMLPHNATEFLAWGGGEKKAEDSGREKGSKRTGLEGCTGPVLVHAQK